MMPPEPFEPESVFRAPLVNRSESRVLYLHIGGLMAAGFDRSGEYLLTVSHSGRGVFETQTWTRVARDPDLAYPNGGIAIGIGPIDGYRIRTTEKNYATGRLNLVTPDGLFCLEYFEGMVKVEPCGFDADNTSENKGNV